MRRDGRLEGGDGSDLKWIKGPTRGMFHVMGCFDDGRRLYVDMPLSKSNLVPFMPQRDGAPYDPVAALAYMTRVSVDTSRGRYAGRVYVSYTQTDFQGDKGVAVTVFDARLRPLAGYPVDKRPLLVSPPPQARPADQFWPASAVDPATGALWVCFYDTKGDPARRKAWSRSTSRPGPAPKRPR